MFKTLVLERETWPPRARDALPLVLPGSVIGNYRVLDEIASGGQGVVLRAQHLQLGTPAAVKLLHDDDEETRRRFRREARTLARLRHPNLLRVPDYGTLRNGLPYMVMELVDGSDLRELVRRRGLPRLRETVRVLATLADTLDYCHQRGVVHRDIKPQNILIEQASGRPVLVDFGLVKRDRLRLAWSTRDRGSITRLGDLIGTPAYIPPEQADSSLGPVGPRSDVYGLGATLYFMLTGEPPFAEKGLIGVLTAVMSRRPVDPRRKNPYVPDSLAELCMASLEKDPDRRPPSAAAFAKALRGTFAPWKTVRDFEAPEPSPAAAPPSAPAVRSRTVKADRASIFAAFLFAFLCAALSVALLAGAALTPPADDALDAPPASRSSLQRADRKSSAR